MLKLGGRLATPGEGRRLNAEQTDSAGEHDAAFRARKLAKCPMCQGTMNGWGGE